MKTLLNNKILNVVLVSLALTGCGGGSSKDNGAASSAPASVAASSTPSSVAASSMEASSVAASSVDASSEGSSTASSAPSAALVIYEDAALPAWHPWDCCGGTTPAVVVSSEVEHGQVAEFSITNSTVVGFTSRSGDGAVGGAVFDATSIKSTGTISFDLKMTQAPTAGVVAWKFKVESNGGGAGNAAEVDLTTSHEGHTTPVLNTWQTYTFNISALETAGVNVSKLDLFMVFPAWGSGAGAHFQIDNMKIFSTGAN